VGALDEVAAIAVKNSAQRPKTAEEIENIEAEGSVQKELKQTPTMH
jgi:hypothetical protein